MKQLIDFIDHWRPRRALVVGDFMLDHYLFGNADRLSPDAPVPVLSIVREETRAGGAANVCIMLRALRCEVSCVGAVGRDDHARRLRDHLKKTGCQITGLVTADDRPTTVKRSYIGLAQHRHPQKMFRADFERAGPLALPAFDQLIEHVEGELADCDVVCIEDYNKGVIDEAFCQAVIDMARKHRTPVLVDPAATRNFNKYRRATAITPNRTEARIATDLTADSEAQLQQVAERILTQEKLDAVVLTLDRHGAYLLEKGGEGQHISTEARNVYDVTGAGDMVLAMLAAAVANGADWPTAVTLANVAGGLEVERFGVAAIPLEDVHLHLLKTDHGRLGKVRTVEQLLPELNAYRKHGRRIAFTNGCFDILHAGHVEMLRSARKTADMLVLAVNSDASIRKLKGGDRPIVSEQDRLDVLSELECVDYIVLFGDGAGGDADTPRPLLEQIKPDVLVKGGQYAHNEVVGWEIVESYGGRVETIPHVEGRSTTNIVEKIRSQADES